MNSLGFGMASERESRLAALRARIEAMAGLAPARAEGGLVSTRAEGGLVSMRAKGGAVPLGLAEVEAALPWGGLPPGCLHEVMAPADGAEAAAGFCAHLAARLAGPNDGKGGALAWVLRQDTLYLPGLAPWGIDPARLILAWAASEAEALWALEECARSPALAVVVGEVRTLDLTQSRRLQLAAESSGVTVLALRPTASAPSAAVTRWQVAPAPGEGNDWSRRRWRLELRRCRGGEAAQWLVDVNDETGDLSVAAGTGDRPDLPRPARLAR